MIFTQRKYGSYDRNRLASQVLEQRKQNVKKRTEEKKELKELPPPKVSPKQPGIVVRDLLDFVNNYAKMKALELEKFRANPEDVRAAISAVSGIQQYMNINRIAINPRIRSILNKIQSIQAISEAERKYLEDYIYSPLTAEEKYEPTIKNITLETLPFLIDEYARVKAQGQSFLDPKFPQTLGQAIGNHLNVLVQFGEVPPRKIYEITQLIFSGQPIHTHEEYDLVSYIIDTTKDLRNRELGKLGQEKVPREIYQNAKKEIDSVIYPAILAYANGDTSLTRQLSTSVEQIVNDFQQFGIYPKFNLDDMLDKIDNETLTDVDLDELYDYFSYLKSDEAYQSMIEAKEIKDEDEGILFTPGKSEWSRLANISGYQSPMPPLFTPPSFTPPRVTQKEMNLQSPIKGLKPLGSYLVAMTDPQQQRSEVIPALDQLLQVTSTNIKGTREDAIAKKMIKGEDTTGEERARIIVLFKKLYKRTIPKT